MIKGFYYHYKHDPEGDITNYAYEVLGLAKDTETSQISVVYKPLYKNESTENLDFFIRPLEMFTEEVDLKSNRVKRFQLITDEVVLNKLKKLSIK